MRDRMYSRLASFPSDVQTLRKRHLHFAVTPLPDLHERWLPELLQQATWRSPRRVLVAASLAGQALLTVSAHALQARAR